MIRFETYAARRQKLVNAFKCPVFLMGHTQLPRTYPAAPFPFRQDSTFLYYTGWNQPGAAALLTQDGWTLFLPEPHEDDEFWHDPSETFQQVAEKTGATQVLGWSKLREKLRSVQTEVHSPLVADPVALHELRNLVGARVGSPALTDQIIAQRLIKDQDEIGEIQLALQVTAEAHQAAHKMCRPGVKEQQIAGAVLGIFARAGHSEAYGSIITVRGEILHCKEYSNTLESGQILLMDAGSEAPSGYASDVTRCFPVGGKFSALQRDVYQAVLASQEAAISMCRSQVRYLDVHLAACLVLAEALVDMGFLKGSAQDLVAQGAHALFFPHGIGHLLGLDVHDMEGFGDRAGYAPGRTRSPQFGTGYLRMDRDLEPGMVVTIEPGIYFIPSILNRPAFRRQFSGMVDFDRAVQQIGLGGIRIEDDILVTDTYPLVLSAHIPKTLDQIEQSM